MLNGLIIAIAQLAGSYLLASTPILTSIAGQVGTLARVQGSPIAEAALLAACIGVAVWLIGLVLAVILGARYPLVGAFLLSVIFAVGLWLAAKLVPGIQGVLSATAGRITAAAGVRVSDLHLVALAAFVGYWLNMLMRR